MRDLVVRFACMEWTTRLELDYWRGRGVNFINGIGWFSE